MTYDEMLISLDNHATRAEQSLRKLEKILDSFPDAYKADILAHLREKHPDFKVLRDI
jgi:hypothetical protein